MQHLYDFSYYTKNDALKQKWQIYIFIILLDDSASGEITNSKERWNSRNSIVNIL